ncbi:hypothetical protein EON65_35110 [archaeon]|nr:MAG: hypothetical protein EON65_35110 [archaeon]
MMMRMAQSRDSLKTMRYGVLSSMSQVYIYREGTNVHYYIDMCAACVLEVCFTWLSSFCTVVLPGLQLGGRESSSRLSRKDSSGCSAKRNYTIKR